MTQISVAPPAFASLVWDECQAKPTERFWSLYHHNNQAGRRAMESVGIFARKENWKGWTVYFSPAGIDPDVIFNTISQLELDGFAAGLKVSDSQRSQQQAVDKEERQRREERDRRREQARAKLIDRFGSMTDGELIAAAKKEAGHELFLWSAFCVNSKRMWSFANPGTPLSLIQAIWLTELVDRTRQKVNDARENIVAKPDAVDWSDADVVRAVETLTEDDMDRASSENGIGWSKADSSRGHWCRGMIRRGGADRMIGIDAARQILRKYEKQLGMRDARVAAGFDKLFDEVLGDV